MVGEHSRNSLINKIQNESGNTIAYDGFTQLESITLTEDNVSKDRAEYIEIQWEPIESPYFYQYEIWKTLGTPSSDNIPNLIVSISDPEVNHFWDRNVGSGTTFYYSVTIVDIVGRRENSDFIPGFSSQ